MDPLLQLLQKITADFKKGELKVPSLPEVVFKVRTAIQDENKTPFQIAKLIQLDPVLTARIIQISNSPLYRREGNIEDCHAAINRIGMNITRNLVTSFAVQQVFGAKHPVVRKALKDVWRHSAQVAAIAYVLGRVTPGIQPDKALLGGLLHDIGILPILRYTESCPEVLENKKQFQSMIAKTSARLGRLVMKSWGMDDDLQLIPESIGEDNYAPESAVNYIDIIIVSHFHNDYSENKRADLEFLADVSSFKKLSFSKFGSDASLELIEGAKDEIGEIMSLVSN